MRRCSQCLALTQPCLSPTGVAQIDRLNAVVAQQQAELQQAKDAARSGAKASSATAQLKLEKTIELLEAEAKVTKKLERELDKRQQKLTEMTAKAQQAAALQANLESEQSLNRALESRVKTLEQRAEKAEGEAEQGVPPEGWQHFAPRKFT